MMRTLRLWVIVLMGLAGLAAGSPARADGLTLDCGSASIDFSKGTFSQAGQDYTITAVDYVHEEQSFNLRVEPTEGLSEADARFQVVMATGIICMQLDASPAEIAEGKIEDGAWLFAAGCTGHVARMGDKC